MTLADSERVALTRLLADARWFSGGGREWQVATVCRIGEVPTSGREGLRVVIDLAEVSYTDGEPGDREGYQVPLACYAEPQPHLEHAALGRWHDDQLGEVFVYDAVHDRVAMGCWLDAFDRAETSETLTFYREPGYQLDTTAHSTLFSGQQSNTSVAFGEDSMLKIFRKLTPGINPDISIHRVLTEAGSDHVAHLYGWLESDLDGEPVQLAMLQQLLRTATDGWELALVSVRNLFTEAELHPRDVGGDFAGESARLGRALGETHASLAQLFPRSTLGPAAVATKVAQLRQRCDAALNVVPDLKPYADRLGTAYDQLAELDELPVQTIHGDLHLGQTLRTVKGWKIVDFEGEPDRPLAERVKPDSPWRDVAGMLRSFDYAPHFVALTSHPEVEEPVLSEGAHREDQTLAWSRRNQAAFLHAYAERALTEEERIALSAYLADKAVYEAVYESRHRPAWVEVPLRALAGLDSLPALDSDPHPEPDSR